MINQKFGKWTVINEAPKKETSRAKQYTCICECGTTRIIPGGALRSKYTTQCAQCCKKQNILRLKKHGRSYDSIYITWQQAKKRCTNQKDKDWHYYGGRGIKVCDRWLNSFDNFMIDMGERPTGYQIDRINVNGNYEPSNCKWVTPKENMNNRRQSKKNNPTINIF